MDKAFGHVLIMYKTIDFSKIVKCSLIIKNQNCLKVASETCDYDIMILKDYIFIHSLSESRAKKH